MTPLHQQLLVEQEIAPFRDMAVKSASMALSPRIILHSDGTSDIEQVWANERWKSTHDLSLEAISIIRSRYALKYEDGSTLTNWIE